MCRNILLLCIIILCSAVGTAQKKIVKYEDWRKLYAHFRENDPKAIPTIEKSILSAKNTGDLVHLLHAYEDAAFATPDRLLKLKYADSCIITSLKTKNHTLISMAYLGKGIVYYFNFKKYDEALKHYLLAADNAEKTKDDYLKYKIRYQIGIVKSYAGHSEDAIGQFEKCLSFFEQNLKKKLHPHLRYNNTRGFLNTLHQISICQRRLDKFEKAQEIISRANKYINTEDYSQEMGYFQKESGIISYQKQDYPKAIESLLSAESELLKKKEESYLITTYFYLGSCFLKMSEWEKAYPYLKKVDSLYIRNEAVSDEVIKTYDTLLRNKNFAISTEDRNHYIDQLLKLEYTFRTEMPHLSSKVNVEYDRKNLISENIHLLKGQKKQDLIQTFLISIGASTLLFLFLLWFHHRNIKKRYVELQLKLSEKGSPMPVAKAQNKNRKQKYADEIIHPILERLEKFEQTTQFTDPHLTLEKLTKILDTNKNYLSYLLNEHRNTSFYDYRGALRIHYITRLMNDEPKYLKYTVEALAEMCGIASRQQFTKYFIQFNHLTPTQYIEQRKKDLNII